MMGGMGLRHTHGIAEAKRVFGKVRLAAVCDQHIEAADHVASEAERLMGYRPSTYTDFTRMLNTEKNLDLIDIVTDTRMHHVFAIEALSAGVNVITEKPLGITFAEGRKLLDAANAAGLRIGSAPDTFNLISLPRASISSSVPGKRFRRSRIALGITMRPARSMVIVMGKWYFKWQKTSTLTRDTRKKPCFPRGDQSLGALPHQSLFGL